MEEEAVLEDQEVLEDLILDLVDQEVMMDIVVIVLALRNFINLIRFGYKIYEKFLLFVFVSFGKCYHS